MITFEVVFTVPFFVCNVGSGLLCNRPVCVAMYATWQVARAYCKRYRIASHAVTASSSAPLQLPPVEREFREPATIPVHHSMRVHMMYYVARMYTSPSGSYSLLAPAVASHRW